MKKNNVLFTSNHTLVHLSSDPFNITLPLVVHEISLVDQSCLLVPDLIGQTENETQSFKTRSTLPYGYNNDIKQLQRRCLEYINKVSQYPLDIAETIIGDTSEMTWEILRAVCRFEHANQIVRKASVSHVRTSANVLPIFARESFSGNGRQICYDLIVQWYLVWRICA
jgi:hypothetical protein